MNLYELIKQLGKRHPDMEVENGFSDGRPGYRCDYFEAVFDPCEKTTIGKMLHHAQALLGISQDGDKSCIPPTVYGGAFTRIGRLGECGEEITKHHFLYWDLLAKQKGEQWQLGGMNSHRRVKVFKWSGGRNGGTARKVEVGIGILHGWGVDSIDEDDGAWYCFSTAIVELPGGKILNVNIELVEFIDG